MSGTTCCGVTCHLRDRSIYLYRGLPACYGYPVHTDSGECWSQCAPFLFHHTNNLISINAWVHFPDDQSLVWVQSSFITYFFPSLSESVPGSVPHFATYVNREVGFQTIALLVDIWYDLCQFPNWAIPRRPLPLTGTAGIWHSMFVQQRVDQPSHRARIVLCPSVRFYAYPIPGYSYGINFEENSALQMETLNLHFPPIRVFMRQRSFEAQMVRTYSSSPTQNVISTISGNRTSIVNAVRNIFFFTLRQS